MKTIKLAGIVAVASLTSAPAFAVTRVFINNNSSLSLEVSTKQSGHRLARDKWRQTATRVGPGQRAEIVWFNRDSGIKNGKEFVFTSKVTAGGSRIVLKQRLRGKAINSHMWQSLENQPWHDDRTDHDFSWKVGGETIRVLYRAVPAGSEDNVEYTFSPAVGASSGRVVWVGSSPVCEGKPQDCEARDMDYVRSDKSGDGSLCISGVKVLCRERSLPQQSGAGDSIDSFNVFNWNIFARPFLVTHDGQNERLRHVPRAIAELKRRIDVIVFEEAFLKGDYRAKLLRDLRTAGFPHATRVLDHAMKPSNGAVFIASRWPIVRERQHIYALCAGSDCLAAKGVMYARVRKTVGRASRNYHVFGTHMQAWATKKNDTVRLGQAALLRKFVRGQGIPSNEGVIIAGDLNANLLGTKGFGQKAHAQELLRTLRAELPTRLGSRVANSDPADNQLVGGDGAADDNGCGDAYRKQRRCTCCPTEMLAYVVHSKEFRRAKRATYQILRLKAKQPFPACMTAKVQPHHVEPHSPFCGKTWMLTDLSDHYPVIAEFDFSR